jgi:hypothetical protein
VVHLYWDVPATFGPIREASAVLEVLVAPRTPHTVFWALQASFTDADGAKDGAAHLGLQWYPPHPRSRAVNWGGYPPEHQNWSSVLEGSESALPSTTDDPNTRDFGWEPLRAYELRIAPSPDRGWRGTVTDRTGSETTVVRDLWAPGDRLIGLVVWTEWFCPCKSPSSAVRWSEFSVVNHAGERHVPDSVSVSHPADSPCTNITHVVEQDGPGARIQQILNAKKQLLPHGTVIPVGAGSGPANIYM